MTVVAIHQPNFFPWLGYFDKLARADVFVLLDDAQASKGSWHNRVKLLIGGRPAWATAPIVRTSGANTINQLRFQEQMPWREKLLKTVRASYGKAANFESGYELVETLLSERTTRLADFNEHAIRTIAGHLNLNPSIIVRSSAFNVTETATDRLVALVRATGGDTYLSGGGATGYQEDAKFEAAGIGLIKQRFDHPVYDQRGHEFVPGLSVLDALLHCGFAEVTAMLQ